MTPPRRSRVPLAVRAVRAVLLSLVLLAAARARAHEVVWWGNEDGFTPLAPLELVVSQFTRYPDLGGEYEADAAVTPTADEPCIVAVNLEPSASTLIRASLEVGFLLNAQSMIGNEVFIDVDVLRPPAGGDESAVVKGEWHATGIPLFADCTAVFPHLFTIPVRVRSERLIAWGWLKPMGDAFAVNTGFKCNLQWAPSPEGPWVNVGKGMDFVLCADMDTGYFRRTKGLGGFVSGAIVDDQSKPLPKYDFGLTYGGLSLKSGLDGTFYSPRFPKGDSLVTISNASGASLNIVVSPTNAVVETFKVALDSAPPPVPKPAKCDCSPWCAIGFGTTAGLHTPVYYSGGAQGGTVGCDAVVMVTPPKGAAYAIRPGRGDSQNSGPNPASGVWTVTTTVCGKSKSVSITVP